jgi:hypothetical protein
MVVDCGGTSRKVEDYASTSDEKNVRQPGAGAQALLTFYSEVMRRKKDDRTGRSAPDVAVPRGLKMVPSESMSFF